MNREVGRKVWKRRIKDENRRGVKRGTEMPAVGSRKGVQGRTEMHLGERMHNRSLNGDRDVGQRVWKGRIKDKLER